MLSRIAESLFWIGRYVERSEDTARLLQMHLRMLAEETSGSEIEASRNLLALMSIDAVEEPTHADVLRILGYDSAEFSSIVAAWSAARDNARRAREVIPAELWECINTTWHGLPSRGFDVAGAYTFLTWARERSALFQGIARGTMVRDEGWQFMQLGRTLEQIDMTSRMVSSASLAVGGSAWPSVLRGCGGHDAFLRTYGGLYDGPDAARFLIVDWRFPRSIMHGLVSAADCLAKVSQDNHGAVSSALRPLGQLRAHLEYADIDQLVEDLDDEMVKVQEVATTVTEIVSASFFASADPTAWTTEGTR